MPVIRWWNSRITLALLWHGPMVMVRHDLEMATPEPQSHSKWNNVKDYESKQDWRKFWTHTYPSIAWGSGGWGGGGGGLLIRNLGRAVQLTQRNPDPVQDTIDVNLLPCLRESAKHHHIHHTILFFNWKEETTNSAKLHVFTLLPCSDVLWKAVAVQSVNIA